MGWIKNIRRIDRGDLLARLGRHKLVVNEEANGLGVGAPVGSSQLHGDVGHDGGVVKLTRRQEKLTRQATDRRRWRRDRQTAQRPKSEQCKHPQEMGGAEGKSTLRKAFASAPPITIAIILDNRGIHRPLPFWGLASRIIRVHLLFAGNQMSSTANESQRKLPGANLLHSSAVGGPAIQWLVAPAARVGTLLTPPGQLSRSLQHLHKMTAGTLSSNSGWLPRRIRTDGESQCISSARHGGSARGRAMMAVAPYAYTTTEKERESARPE